jgi:hypothetical protein
MAVDFNLPPEILVIHGVQTGDDADLRQHEVIKSNLDALLSNPDLHFDDPLEFHVDIIKYEDINDTATQLVRRILATLTGNAIAGWVVDKAVDLISDVWLAISEGDVYAEVTEHILDRVSAIHSSGKPLYLVAHSLGSFYAFEAINGLIGKLQMASPDKRNWPVHGLVTIGSPLGLELFKRNVDSLKRRQIQVNVKSTPRFPWKNFWDNQDPIVTGSIMGFPKASQFPFRFDRQAAKHKGWSIRADQINSGHTAHLGAHTAYWTDKTVGQGIVNMLYVDRENL